ncbi:hypothetical protein HPB50_001121 [Hyalomma asiaticum]|uniref:Uncharacterized protein n=1 Tax=Hyalomma asiaticum TaxID=266040 RepID=A0ACB7RYF2_HYAAI|nr:hypothetical protein HPB50_001121 [Hyalomma asiaticum]
MADLPPDFPPGYALSSTSNRSRAYDLLLREAGEIIRRDASKLPLSPRRRMRRTKRRTRVRHRKQGLTAKAATAPTESLLNTESFLANFVLPDPPLPPAKEAEEAAAANVSTPPTTRDSTGPPLPPPEEAEEAAAAIFTTPAPTTRDSPPPVLQITGTPRELVFREEVENTPHQRESDGTNPSFSSAPSSPSTSSDVSANQLISAAPANATVQGASSSPSQPKEKAKEAHTKETHGRIQRGAVVNLSREREQAASEVQANLDLMYCALDQAKDAVAKERNLSRQREQAASEVPPNLDLMYCALFNLAVQYTNNQMYTEALSTYQVIVKNKAFSNAGRLKLNMGDIYFYQGNYSKAIKFFRMALDQVPNTHKDMRAVSFAGRAGPWENQQAYFLLPRRNRSTPACSTTRGRSGQGPGTRPGQALPLCTHGRTEGSSTTRGAEYVFAEQFQWAGTPGSTAAPLSVTTALTELRHRTLDDFDSVTSLATSSSPLNRMSIF